MNNLRVLRDSWFYRLPWLRIVVHVGGWMPLVMLIADAALGQLGAEPIRAAILRTGKAALVQLVLSLACTPLNTLFGFKAALQVRRALGLYAFMYAAIHFTLFVGVDYGFNWALLKDALLSKRYTLVGMGAGTLLLVLAATSFKYWKKRLGKGWKRLHRLVYLATLLAAVHFIWLVKPGVAEPYYWLAGIGGLLLLRLPVVRRGVTRLRQGGGRRGSGG
jgi:sulfoxide reductase heme-binding subunit YedZ